MFVWGPTLMRSSLGDAPPPPPLCKPFPSYSRCSDRIQGSYIELLRKRKGGPKRKGGLGGSCKRPLIQRLFFLSQVYQEIICGWVGVRMGDPAPPYTRSLTALIWGLISFGINFADIRHGRRVQMSSSWAEGYFRSSHLHHGT